MHRYIAFAWDKTASSSSPTASMIVQRMQAISSAWNSVLAVDGLLAYQIESPGYGAYPLRGTEGIVLGTLFEACGDSEPHSRAAGIGEQETREIQASSGRRLVDRYWGRYVLILRDDDGIGIRVLRDPSGGMPCFITEFRGISIICSHIEDCRRIGLLDTSINWDHVIASLWLTRFVSRHTGLKSVRRVHAGECVAIHHGRAECTFFWTPARVCESEILDDRRIAMQALRTSVQFSVSTWASCYDRVLHELSGGIDSAIVLACLTGTGPEVLCQNFFTEGAEGDERVFARAAATHANVELIETPIRPSVRSLDSMFDSELAATPLDTALLPEYAEAREELLQERRIQAVLSGQGGDHFFQRLKTPMIAAECAWRHGLSRQTLRAILDSSRLTRRPWWSVAAAALAYGLFRWRTNADERPLRPPPLLSKNARDAVDLQSVRHPWLEGARDLPASKTLQIAELVASQNLRHLSSQHSDVLHPLISQPIIETCLRIPSYHLTYGGIDRALVRHAFSGMLPAEVARRTTKGGTSGYVIGTLIANLNAVRELLMEGLLVKEGLLDRARIEGRLTEPGLIGSSELFFPTLIAIQTEVWLRMCAEPGPRVTP